MRYLNFLYKHAGLHWLKINTVQGIIIQLGYTQKKINSSEIPEILVAVGFTAISFRYILT